MTAIKTPGQIAYEADCRARPTYDDGTPRRPWEQLCDIAKLSWEQQPTPAAGLSDWNELIGDWNELIGDWNE